MISQEGTDVEKGRINRKNFAMPTLPKLLTVEEKKYLLSVERGDLGNVKRMLQIARRRKNLDIDCVDSLGRGALAISIDQENLEMVELLIIMGVKTGDALLHAINVEFVEAVELLLEHEEIIHKEGELYSWQGVDSNTASFTPDITPLILAAHRNNYEILKLLLDRGATLPMPHDIKCGCDECIKQSQQDSLRQALSRLNEYRALASPSLMALSSSDPILTAFELSWELRNLAFAEPECKEEYMDLRKQCQQFAVDLLHQSRSSYELAILLNHDPEDPTAYEEGDHMQLSRLKLAIQYKQKKFVSHSNIQQLLAAIWYEGVPGFRRKTSFQKIAITVKVAMLFPFYCMLYIIAPNTNTGKLMRKPFMKFLIHASSYLFFLLILILVSQRAEDLFIEYFGSEDWRENVMEKYDRQRGNPPMILEYIVLIYVIGFIYEETNEMYVEGISDYLRNMWNIIDFTRNSLYTAVIFLRLAAYVEQNAEIVKNPDIAYLRREEWAAFDFQLVAEGLFAAANIFSAVKLVHLFSINPHLGPLQISLGRMVIDIVKFFFIYSLVLFAFACGLNQLLWYFSDLERQKCFHLPDGRPDFDNNSDSCMKWRRFANVFESSQSLFWASFGLVDLTSFELTGIKTYTRFWGLLMFGSYSVINVIVLLNLLIAMMSNSYAIIDEHSDTEWKFARTKLWMSYFDESSTLPSPFNIFPTPKMFLKLFGLRKRDKLRKLSSKRKRTEEKERDFKYSAVIRALVWRYVATMHKKEEENPVTEDDVNELKSDISSFRYEIMDVLRKNGMAVSNAEKREKAILGKKNKIWERRLMKDFKVGPIVSEEDEEMYSIPLENESPTSRFRRIAKLAVLNSAMNKWKRVVKGVCIASQIGHCHNRDSFKKQQNLQKAMQEADKFSTFSPENYGSISPMPIISSNAKSSDNMVNIVKNIKDLYSDPTYSSSAVLKIPSLGNDESDLINLESQNTSPAVTNKPTKSPTFKYILEVGNRDIKSPNESNQRSRSLSPKSFSISAAGRNIELESPTMSKNMSLPSTPIISGQYLYTKSTGLEECYDSERKLGPEHSKDIIQTSQFKIEKTSPNMLDIYEGNFTTDVNIQSQNERLPTASCSTSQQDINYVNITPKNKNEKSDKKIYIPKKCRFEDENNILNVSFSKDENQRRPKRIDEVISKFEKINVEQDVVPSQKYSADIEKSQHRKTLIGPKSLHSGPILKTEKHFESSDTRSISKNIQKELKTNIDPISGPPECMSIQKNENELLIIDQEINKAFSTDYDKLSSVSVDVRESLEYSSPTQLTSPSRNIDNNRSSPTPPSPKEIKNELCLSSSTQLETKPEINNDPSSSKIEECDTDPSFPSENKDSQSLQIFLADSIPSKSFDESVSPAKDVTPHFLGPSKNIEDAKSPLASRNIHRVQKKYQPKLGWL